jgi:hypothetical protein
VLLLKDLQAAELNGAILKNALDATPGKHTKSAEAIEREEDALRSGAKERKRVCKRLRENKVGWKAELS